MSRPKPRADGQPVQQVSRWNKYWGIMVGACSRGVVAGGGDDGYKGRLIPGANENTG